mmetsp:Transcript_73543/g.161077  ORF Transcript_73543/g.161077 Transcript_73543/m.161077 type:complete len:808 (-) Transcript_73543:154-2577(-)
MVASSAATYHFAHNRPQSFTYSSAAAMAAAASQNTTTKRYSAPSRAAIKASLAAAADEGEEGPDLSPQTTKTPLRRRARSATQPKTRSASPSQTELTPSPTARDSTPYHALRAKGFRSDFGCGPPAPSSPAPGSRLGSMSFAPNDRKGELKVQEQLVEKWRKQNGCPKSAKIFICSPMCPALRDELLAKGWFQNTDMRSTVFDLKWSSSNGDVSWGQLTPSQILNTLEDDTCLTTKYGLTRTLRHAKRMVGVSSETFYPRAFCLQDPTERMGFMADFRLSKAEAILDAFLQAVEKGTKDESFQPEVVEAAIQLCESITEVSCEDMVKPEKAGIELGLQESWHLVENADLFKPRKANPITRESSTLQSMVESSYRRKWSVKVAPDSSPSMAATASAASNGRGSLLNASMDLNATASSVASSTTSTKAKKPTLVARARKALATRAKSRKGPPMRGQNTWIVKPTCRSRGEGIEVHQDLGLILKRACRDAFRWIAQKYIERPQLIHGFKFDIRQWVLVTSWKPLTIYIWKQPFLRFASKKYDDSIADLSKSVHLTNNSPLKGTAEFEEEHEELHTKGFMWYRQQYEDWLHTSFCKRKHHCTPWLHTPPYKSWEEGHPMECGACDTSEASTSPGEGEGESLSSSAKPSPRAAGGSSENIAESNESSKEREDKEGSVLIEADDEDNAEGEKKEKKEPTPCKNLWDSSINPQIKDVIRWTLASAADKVKARRNTHSLFGFDLMISHPEKGKPKVWLLEVNKRPDLSYSTPIKFALVKKMFRDTAAVMVDLPHNSKTDIGEWELLPPLPPPPAP